MIIKKNGIKKIKGIIIIIKNRDVGSLSLFILMIIKKVMTMLIGTTNKRMNKNNSDMFFHYN